VPETDTFTPLRVAAAARIAEDIHRFELVHPDGAALPAFTAGAHLKVRVPGGLVRRYSLCSDPNDDTRYAIAVNATRAVPAAPSRSAMASRPATCCPAAPRTTISP
jgi:ferredoxin-NADP reductase